MRSLINIRAIGQQSQRFGRAFALALAAISLALLQPPAASAGSGLIEPPELTELVQEGKLPPVTKRLPQEPLVTGLDRSGL
jgi:hypothetical protein